jgi:hypothetical protein
MKVNLAWLLIWIIIGLVNGYVWSEPILNLVRTVFPSTNEIQQEKTVAFDGWWT